MGVNEEGKLEQAKLRMFQSHLQGMAMRGPWFSAIDGSQRSSHVPKTVLFVVTACLICFGSAGAACIDYGDYLHWVGSVGTHGLPDGVAVSGNYAYVADYNSGLHILSAQCVNVATSIGGGPQPGLVGILSAWPNPAIGNVSLRFAIPSSEKAVADSRHSRSPGPHPRHPFAARGARGHLGREG